MKIYHTFYAKNGFDLDKINFDRGIFAIEAWWTGKKGYEKYSAFNPNEFGDTVVELDIDEEQKTYTCGDQIDVLEKFFKGNKTAEDVINKYETGTMEQKHWQLLDEFIGKFLKKRGYKIIHYTSDQMYGNTWAILDKSVIKKIRFE